MKEIKGFDERRDILIGNGSAETIELCVKHFLHVGQQAINHHHYFAVALSGGSTPKAIYEALSQEKYRDQLDWKKVFLFWSDERSVPPTHSESNYLMAMEAGFSLLPIDPANIFRMVAEDNIEIEAKIYEQTFQKKVPSGHFDLIMLGMGEDGHTASLFPKTHGLDVKDRLTIANYVPQKKTWRMTLTFDCINHAHHIAIYVLGKNKAEMVKRILTTPYDPDNLPIQKIGTAQHKALWVMDKEAAFQLEQSQ